jgi:tetratricopeptide (TPR) repeat protein
MAFDPMHLVLHTEQLLDGSSVADTWMAAATARDPEFPRRHREERLAYSAWTAAVADSAAAHRRYAEDLLRAGRLGEAMDAARAALARDPGLGDAHRIVGRAQERSGDLDAALASFALAIRIDGSNLEASLGTGRVLYGLGQYDAALAALEAAAAPLDAPDAEIQRGMALVLDALGRTADAARARRLERQAREAERRGE